VEEILVPIYEYRCTACDHAFEALVQGSQKPSCPICSGRKLEKQFSAFAVTCCGNGSSMALPAGGG
jgi:putative FmdB family regulatory protein